MQKQEGKNKWYNLLWNLAYRGDIVGIYDTIAAISTPLGEGGIGIVRISGDDAFEIAEKIFVSVMRSPLKEFASHTIHYGHIIQPNTGEIIDEVLLTIMRKPRTYTREDIVEINCHGGFVPLQRVLEVVLEQGARIAEPGEFTKRAFLNGRLDLSQAEAIIDVIRAKTDKGLNVAMKHLQGDISSVVNRLMQMLLEVVANLEVVIDFPDEDIEELNDGQMLEILSEIKTKIDELIKTADNGRILREGIKTVIIGKPNVGKSSLLNALLRENRAIVTDIPGTTRDIIEEVLNIRGVPLRIIDTAGIRETLDRVEKIGVEKAKEMIDEGDLVLLVLDGSSPLTFEDRQAFQLARGKKTIVVINKTDRGIHSEFRKALEQEGVEETVAISALYKENLSCLEEAIEKMFFAGGIAPTNEPVITNVRHKAALQRATKSIDEAIEGIRKGLPADIVSVDLQNARGALGEITGETVEEELLNHIFSQFCLGK